MKIFLEKIIFVNRAPFHKIDLELGENDINVLMAINGSGKTTVLSHITDAFFEMAKPHFHNEFEENRNKFYRVSSNIYNLDFNKPSIVYLRFRTSEGQVDYIDVRNNLTSQEYDEYIQLDDKINFSVFSAALIKNGNVKKTSANFKQELAKKVFYNNVLTYFPAYRYEMPGYLNEPYKIKLDYKKDSGFSGYLNNPLEVITGLKDLANWIMDIVLDLRVNNKVSDAIMFNNLTKIISETLKSRGINECGFAIGERNLGSTRIQIVRKGGIIVYPNIFNLSSGENALLCTFGEILHQADNNRTNIPLHKVTGIILIDEIDKHLHIKLQKEILPELLNLFPNVQFILSSHSPFLSIGLAEKLKNRSKIIDLDNLGITKDPTRNKLYEEVYYMMVNENDRFKELFLNLKSQLDQNDKTLIITEGKTDIQHLKRAAIELEVDLSKFNFFNAESDSKLSAMLEQLSKIRRSRKIIGLFDRDVPQVVSSIEKNGNDIKEFGNQVYAFCIPKPPHRQDYNNISIEFYYSDQDLKNPNNGKKLYFNNELNFDSKRKPISINQYPVEDFYKKIWCENIGDLDWIHSKSRFADLVEKNNNFVAHMNFNHFRAIFKIISQINAV